MSLIIRLVALFLISALPARAEAPTAWNPRAAELCLLPPYADPLTPEQVLAKELLDRIDALPGIGLPLTTPLRQTGVALCIDDSPPEARGYFEVESGLIALNQALSFDEKLVILIHELRHLEQFSRGYCPSVEFDLAEMVRFAYAIEADAQAITTYLTWKIREAGDSGPWAALMGMPRYADIASVFEESVDSGTSPGKAVSDAFQQWYDSEWRTAAYYHSTCGAYYDQLDRTKTLRSYEMLPEGYFENLCILPDGSGYDCALPAE